MVLTHGEHDRDMIILGSRLRKGHTKWDPGSLFFRIPGRNMTGSALYNDDKGTLYHFNGLEVATSWKTLAMLMRTSKDNGATWSSPRFIEKRHQWRNQVISGTFQSQEGDLIQLCDATPKGSGGTAFWRRKKRGGMWRDMGRTKKGKLREKPHFWRNKKGAWIAGIHAKAVQLNDGSYMALGRANNKRKGLKWKMPKSISRDGGKNWEYSPSSFPPISYGQRLVLLRLQDGPLFF